MRVAVVGARKGASQSDVEGFVRSMYAKDPDIILISGGAPGVDKWAEDLWMQLGGKVESYRAVQLEPDKWGIEVWKIGSWDTVTQYLLREEPTWANARSALTYRDALIPEHADKVVGFFPRGRRTSGTQITLDFAVGAKRDIYEYFAHA